MMKILHVTTHFKPFIGGLERVVETLARHQKAQVLTLQYDPQLPSKEGFITRSKAFPLLKGRYTWPALGFTKDLDTISAEVIFTHTRFFMTSYLAGRWAQKNNRRWIHVEHGDGFVKNQAWFINAFAWLFDQLFGGWVMRNADQVVVLTPKAQSFVSQRFGRTDSVVMIPHGVPMAKKVKPLPGENRALFFGRMVEGKGVDQLLQAAADCPQWHFILAGEGPLASSVQRSNVEFVGTLDGEDLKQAIDESDLVVLPSKSEGFGLSILESAAQGRPILSADVGIASQLILADFLLSRVNAKYLQKRLNNLLSNSSELRKQGLKSYQKAKAKFSEQAMLKAYEGLL